MLRTVGLSDWPRPLRFAHAQRRQSRDGCRTFPCPLKSGWRAGFGVVLHQKEPSRSRLDEWFLPGAPSGPSATTIAVLPWSPRRAHEILALPLLSARLRTSASSALTTIDGAEKRDMRGCLNWMSQWLHISAHPLPSAGRRKPITVQAMQDHFSTRGTLLRFSWTGGFGAPLYGGSPGLSGQAPLCHRWVWAWSCDSQGAEKWQRTWLWRSTKTTTAQAIGRSMPACSSRSPLWLTLTEIKGCGQGLRPWCSNFPQRPLWTCGGRSSLSASPRHRRPSQAMRHFLPKRSSPAAAQSRPRTAPTQHPAKPTCTCRFAPQPARTQHREGVYTLSPEDATPPPKGARAPDQG